MNVEIGYPLALKIRELENFLLSDYMIGRMHESEEIKLCCGNILGLLKIARSYLVMGKERKAARIFFRALELGNVIINRFHIKV